MAKKKIKKSKPKAKPKKVRAKVKPRTKIKKAKKVGAKTQKKPKTKTVKVLKVVAPKPVGLVTHFFNNIDVAIIKFNIPLVIGTAVQFKGATTDFKGKIASMQYEHKPITTAKKGQQVGVKVKDKVREGDKIYLV